MSNLESNYTCTCCGNKFPIEKLKNFCCPNCGETIKKAKEDFIKNETANKNKIVYSQPSNTCSNNVITEFSTIIRTSLLGFIISSILMIAAAGLTFINSIVGSVCLIASFILDLVFYKKISFVKQELEDGYAAYKKGIIGTIITLIVYFISILILFYYPIIGFILLIGCVIAILIFYIYIICGRYSLINGIIMCNNSYKKNSSADAFGTIAFVLYIIELISSNILCNVLTTYIPKLTLICNYVNLGLSVLYSTFSIIFYLVSRRLYK